MKTPDNTDPWEDLFRKRFDDFDAKPPGDALARILAQANTPKPEPPGSRYRWIGVVVIGLFLLGIGSLLVHNENHPFNHIQSARPQQVEPAEADLSASELSTGDQESVVALKKDALPTSTKQKKITIPQTEAISIEPPTTKSAKSVDAIAADLPTEDAVVTRRVNEKVVSPGGKTDLSTVATLETKPTYTPSMARSTKAGKRLNRKNQQLFTTSVTPFKSSVDSKAKERIQIQGLVKDNQNAIDQPILAVPADQLAVATPEERTNLTIANRLGHGLKLATFQRNLPTINQVVADGQQAKPMRTPALIVSLMPLYTFRQISPNVSDDVYVRQIQADKGVSGDRVGWRLQAGVEWPLSRTLSLRTGIVYGQLRQTVQYSVRGTQADSVLAELIDDKTLQITPIFNDQLKTQTTNWHYAGLSADAVWQLGATQTWHYYLTTGVSVGGYIGPIRRFTGFYQASFGLERPIASKLWLRIEPGLQYGWNAVTDHKNLFLIRPYTYGLTVGLKY